MANRTPLLLVGALVIAVGVWGGKRYLYAKSHVVTDNAQVDGRLLPVSSRLQAYVDRVLVEDNQIVHAGDTLLVLDARDLDARVTAAQADLEGALALTGNTRVTGQLVAQVTAAEATAAGTQATIASAEVQVRKTQADLERIRGLAAKQIVPAQQLDAAQAAFDAATANLESARRQQAAARAQVGVASAAIPGADARVASLRAALGTAVLQRSWTVITAPMDGIVSRRVVEPGALIQPGQTTMTLVPLNEIWVTANVKETHLSKIVIGDSVEFKVDGYGDHAFTGLVESISPATGAKFALLPPDNATGNFTKVVQNVPVHIAIAGLPDPQFPLRPGMSVEVTIRVAR